MEKNGKRPPWWFLTTIWAGIAGTAGLLAAIIRSTAD